MWLLAASNLAQAAGGHHAVDDAALLEPGQCQVETWLDRAQGGRRRLLHAGPSCRVGAVEIGLSLDRLNAPGEDPITIGGAQLKWAQVLTEGFSVGVALGLLRQNRRPAFLGSTLVLPITWQAGENWLIHAQVGRDFRPGQADDPRAGLALEWTPTAWSFVAERFREGRADFWRVGARWALSPSVSVDLSHARGLQRPATPWTTLGLNWAFER